MVHKIHIIGGGLAGSECAYQLLKAGHQVHLYEMRPVCKTAAHETADFAELVCSNSFRSDEWQNNAVGLLHHELRMMDSLIMRAADYAKLPAGNALAVDRRVFSQYVTERLKEFSNLHIFNGEITDLAGFGTDSVVIATGPLTSTGLAAQLEKLTGTQNLAFFDAIAPIVHTDSLDFNMGWFQSRWDKGEGTDYLNFALSKLEYRAFVEELLAGEKTEFKEWERNTPYFEGCLPIEVMAERGIDTLRYGPMKPIGLLDPKEPERRPYAVLQLRRENRQATLWNLVGFQTKLKYADQIRIFRTLPGFADAEFARLGGIHRNSFLNAPLLLTHDLRLKAQGNLRFAGQITGVEGYVESTAIGLLCGLFILGDMAGRTVSVPPMTTALGALIGHITTNANAKTFQPMNCNYGLFEPLDPPPLKTENKKLMMAERAVRDLTAWRVSAIQ